MPHGPPTKSNVTKQLYELTNYLLYLTSHYDANILALKLVFAGENNMDENMSSRTYVSYNSLNTPDLVIE